MYTYHYQRRGFGQTDYGYIYCSVLSNGSWKDDTDGIDWVTISRIYYFSMAYDDNMNNFVEVNTSPGDWIDLLVNCSNDGINWENGSYSGDVPHVDWNSQVRMSPDGKYIASVHHPLRKLTWMYLG